jgi:hypothetical protein
MFVGAAASGLVFRSKRKWVKEGEQGLKEKLFGEHSPQL